MPSKHKISTISNIQSSQIFLIILSFGLSNGFAFIVLRFGLTILRFVFFIYFIDLMCFILLFSYLFIFNLFILFNFEINNILFNMFIFVFLFMLSFIVFHNYILNMFNWFIWLIWLNWNNILRLFFNLFF